MNKRNFSRVIFNTNATVTKDNLSFTGEVKNLSLKGIYISTKDISSLCLKDLVHINFNLLGTTSKISLSLEGIVKHIDQNGIGVEFTTLDLDSFSHLKYIVAYNSGEYDAILEEFEKSSKKIKAVKN
jgi:hypothetical protein